VHSMLELGSEALARDSTLPLPSEGAAVRAPAEQFELLFREFAPYVLRALPRLGVAPADLDDVLQEVFVAVFRGLASFEGRSTHKTWVYGICIRACSNYRQRAHRRRERLQGELPEQDARGTPESALDQRRRLLQLDSALSALPESQRAVFVLFEIEGLEVTEIAAALECSKFTIYTRLYAARRAVEAKMRAYSKEEA
jgi:RNA polymerase sigma-70 factor (ECF subfamily)